MKKNLILTAAIIGSLSSLCCAMDPQQQRRMDEQRRIMANTSAIRMYMNQGVSIPPQQFVGLDAGNYAVASQYNQKLAQQQQQK